MEDIVPEPLSPVVAVSRCSGYEPDLVETALAEALSPLGGMEAFVREGDHVMLKPNLLMKAAPDRAISTHPEVVRAVIRAAKAAGAAEVLVGDSPGGRQSASSMAQVFRVSGIQAVCDEEGARTVFLDDDIVRVPIEGSTLYKYFNLGRAVVECDVLIDLPKLKTHGFQLFTGAVKNLFGCIPGLEKAQFHLKVPDREDFGGMLVDLMLACKPRLSVMDAVVGMEGDGPAGGTPKPIGALLASADAVALDVVASAVAGFDPMDVYTNRVAHRRGLGPASADEVEVAVVPWREVAPPAFERPERDVTAKMPPWIGRAMRRHLTSRPYLAQPEKCTSCRTCENNCPVEAIAMKDRRPDFDYDACIRCYCCQELCPPQVIGLRKPWLVRTVLAPDRERKA
jgi:uncharacterized protein (DUF362 family)/Pyruvate/2-oxoacid:ferredoxin oxidoreductase delta subunit